MAIGFAIAAGVSALSSLIGGAKGKKAAKRESERRMRETEEAVRRQKLDNRQTIGTATAGSYASGIDMSGSNKAYIENMQSEMDRQIAWIRESGASAADAARKQGDSAMISGIAGAAGSIASLGAASYGTFWGTGKGAAGVGGLAKGNPVKHFTNSNGLMQMNPKGTISYGVKPSGGGFGQGSFF